MKNPSKLKYIIAFLKSAPSVLAYLLFKKKPRYDKIGKQKSITLQLSTNLISAKILSEKPFAAIRLGGSEISAINNYEKIRLGFANKYKAKVRYAMKNNAGFFPVTKDNLDHYGKLMLKELKQTDLIGISGLHMENYYYQNYINKAKIVQNWALDPLLGNWSHLLKGKKVLVISPLAKQIETQYANSRKFLFNKDQILPEFELTTIEAVQTIGDQLDPRFDNWFSALDYMKIQILKVDFDIALVGAGAYGTPLCLYIKSIGKQAIQTGGATQLLFGIIGKRWEDRQYVIEHKNNYWVKPNVKPKGFENVEKGCYW